MKNRYLLLVTLIFGLVGQTAQAISLPFRQVDDQQNQIKQLFLQSYFPQKSLHELEADIKDKVEPILNMYAEKYYPGFKPRYQISADTWRAGINSTIEIPYSFIQLILKNRPKNSVYWAEIGSFCHEVTHCLNGDPEYLINVIHTLPFEQRGAETKKMEQRADRGVLDDLKILMSLRDHLKRKAAFEQFSKQQVDPKLESWYQHPSHQERAQYFSERINTLKTDSNNIQANYYRNQNKLDKFFGADAMPLYKPTNLARYSFSRDKEFLKPRITRYWQNALLNN